MKKLLFVLILTVLLIPPGTFAQQQVKDDSEAQSVSVVQKEDQATREDVVALLEVLHSRDQMTAAIEMMKGQLLSGMREGFLGEHPGASPEVVKKLTATMDGVWKVINIDELVQTAIPIYQKYLSHEDVVSLISFYSSPSGQHYLSRMPALIKESGEAGGKVMTGHMEEVQRLAKEKFAEFDKYIAAHPEELGAPRRKIQRRIKSPDRSGFSQCFALTLSLAGMRIRAFA